MPRLGEIAARVSATRVAAREELLEAGALVVGERVEGVDADDVERAEDDRVVHVVPVRRVGERAGVDLAHVGDDRQEARRVRAS